MKGSFGALSPKTGLSRIHDIEGIFHHQRHLDCFASFALMGDANVRY